MNNIHMHFHLPRLNQISLVPERAIAEIIEISKASPRIDCKGIRSYLTCIIIRPMNF